MLVAQEAGDESSDFIGNYDFQVHRMRNPTQYYRTNPNFNSVCSSLESGVHCTAATNAKTTPELPTPKLAGGCASKIAVFPVDVSI